MSRDFVRTRKKNYVQYESLIVTDLELENNTGSGTKSAESLPQRALVSALGKAETVNMKVVANLGMRLCFLTFTCIPAR